MSDETEETEVELPKVKGGKLDLDGMSAAELRNLRDLIDRKFHEKVQEAKNDILIRTRHELAQLGLNLNALLPSNPEPETRKRASGADIPIKYRGPNGETWTGRGRQPRWMEALIAEGRSRDDFKV